MTENSIRLRYSGFILFLFRLISVGTGLLNTLIVTRNITIEEYGIFNNINDVLSYFTLTATIIPFWVMRFSARRRPGAAKTGIVVNAMIATAVATLYLLTISGILYALQINKEYLTTYMIGAFLIMENHMIAVLEAVLRSKRPETIGFGLFVLEISKLPLTFLFIVILRLGLIGALTGLILAFSIQITFYLKNLMRYLKEKIRWNYVKEWFKASLLNIYGITSERILALPNIFLFIYVGGLSRAYYGASQVISSIIGYSSYLAFALYPKLLAGGGREDVATSFKMVLMFAVPMALGAFALSEDLLSILNISYKVAKPVLMALSLNAFLMTLSLIFSSIISGTEDIDADARISCRKLIKSRLFLSITINYVKAAIAVPLTYLIFTSLPLDALAAAVYLALINVSTNIFAMLMRYMIAKKCLKFAIPWVNVGKYFGVSLLMAFILYSLQTPARLTIIVAKVLFGALVYFLILFVIDDETRRIIRFIKKEAAKTFLGRVIAG